VLGETLLDLAGLLVGVNVERHPLAGRVAADLLEPLHRAGAHGVGGDADGEALPAQSLDLVEKHMYGVLPEALDAASCVGDVQQHELDACLRRRVRRGTGLGGADVVELADRRVAGGQHLAVRPGVLGANEIRGLRDRFLEHAVAPGPEIAARRPTPQGPLEGVAVRVDEPGQCERRGHGRRRYTTTNRWGASDYPSTMSSAAVSPVLRQIPNALTILRFAAVPAFAVAFLGAGDEAAWGAGILFGAAAITDQLDGWLARRWQVESRFGRIADPLADRVMISVAAVLLWYEDRLPWPAALIVLGRDLLLVVGYKVLAPQGVEVEVTRLGKVATWILYAGLAFVIVTDKGTAWPLWIFWTGVVLALGAAAQYVVRARRTIAH